IEQFRALKRRIDRKIRVMIEDGIADGSIAPLDPKLLAFALAGALNWPGRWYDPKGPDKPAEIARKLVEILAQGFTSKPR
ncbi:TetR family transcriptional regulator, partial [Novosphingobium malaysiense]